MHPHERDGVVDDVTFGHLNVSSEKRILLDMQNKVLMRFLKSIISIISASLSHVKGYMRMPKQFSMEAGDVICYNLEMCRVSHTLSTPVFVETACSQKKKKKNLANGFAHA